MTTYSEMFKVMTGVLRECVKT